jgi:hypothetical protein
MTRGERCGLPKRQRAASFGCTTRTSSYDIRNAVLTGAPADRLPTRTGPHTRSKRTQEMEARIIRTRCETALKMYEIAATLPQQGFPVSARVVGRVLADYGLAKKNAWHRAPSLPGSLPTRRSKSLLGPTSRGHASSPGLPSSTTSRLYANAASRPRVQGAFSASPPLYNWALRTSPRLEGRPSPQAFRRHIWPEDASWSRFSALPPACALSIRSAAPTSVCSPASPFFPRPPPRTVSCSPFPSRAPELSRPRWAHAWSHLATSRQGIPATSMPTI